MNRQADGFIDALPEPKRKAATRLQQLILETVPEAEERFSYQTPFYYYFGPFCYLTSVRDGIELCFWHGRELAASFPLLHMRKRVMVAGVILKNEKELNRKKITSLIAGAAEWQKSRKAKNRKNKARPFLF